MPKIHFLHKDGTIQIVDAPENWSVMQVAVENKVEGIEGACGGSMACATCHVYVHPQWVSKVTECDNEQSDEEKDILDSAYDVRDSSRLGCQIKITKALDGLVLALPGVKTGWKE